MDMLLIYRKVTNLDFSQLMDVYSETIYRQGKKDYPNQNQYKQRFLVEQDQYQYLLECLTSGAICAVWLHEGQYRAALRLEPYHDGYLLTALETTPETRRKGYAEALVRSVLKAFPDSPIYSHVFRSNKASVALHRKCGFSRYLDHATFLDGSVSTQAVTYVYNKK